MTKNEIVYLNDILDRLRRIDSYTAIGKEDFLASELHQDGVIRCFEIIGEIVKRLDPTLIAQYPHIEWSNFAGFRDILIHQYQKVRMELVWGYILEDLPPLKEAILEMLIHVNDENDTTSTE